MNKKEYEKWLDRVDTEIKRFVDECGIFVSKEYNDGNLTYQLRDIPNIGNMNIIIDTYDTFRDDCRTLGVSVVGIYTKFETWRNKERIEFYGSEMNYYSGKLNFYAFSDKAYQCCVALRNAFDSLLNKVIKKKKTDD